MILVLFFIVYISFTGTGIWYIYIYILIITLYVLSVGFGNVFFILYIDQLYRKCGMLALYLCLTIGWWLSSGIPVSSTNKTDRHDITEILLKVALNIINQAKHILMSSYEHISKKLSAAVITLKVDLSLLFKPILFVSYRMLLH